MNQTLILLIDDPDAIPKAKEVIESGGTIAFPTDTVYGLAGDVFNPQAIRRLYQIKERAREKAIPILVGDIQQLDTLVSEVNQPAKILAKAFWPGPLTLILPKIASLPKDLSPYPTVGIRMPAYIFALRLLKATGPLATTSANLSGETNPRTCQDVINQLGGRIDLILDGGSTPGAIPSTVVDVTGQEIKILRKGPIPESKLLAYLDKYSSEIKLIKDFNKPPSSLFNKE